MTSSHQFELLESGEEYFPKLFKEIDRAEKSISVEAYIFKWDSIGKQLVERLSLAVQRGVHVKLLLDAYGCIDLTREDVEHIEGEGIQLKVFRPLQFFRITHFFFRRLHRKTVVIDRRKAFVGGLNISEDYYSSHPKDGKLDYAVFLQGPMAATISTSIDLVWKFSFKRWLKLSMGLSKRYRDCRYYVRDNFLWKRSIERLYRNEIRRARSSVVIASAYFSPSTRLLFELSQAKRRGLKVQLLLQGKADVPILKWTERFLYRWLLSMGVEIYEYLPQHLHAKVAVIDERNVLIGSSNLDPWSLLSNIESHLLICDRSLAEMLSKSLNHAILKHSKQISLEDLKHLKIWDRLLSFFAYVASRFSEILARWHSN